MDIQKILFPEVGRCTDVKLYYHTLRDEVEENIKSMIPLPVMWDREQKCLSFCRNGSAFFDSYFNGFSIEKWRKYTILQQVSVKLTLKGKFLVSLLAKEKLHSDILETVISETVVEADTPTEFTFPYVNGTDKGMYTFALKSLKEDGIFYGGAYTADAFSGICAADAEGAAMPEVRIGIAICTFRREAFVEKNLRILREAILENEQSPLYGKLEVFIADNGKTLDMDKLSAPGIHIYTNKNYGGSGGFTRDLIEIYKHNQEAQAAKHITHALLMDDDIVIEPEALLKTYCILTLLKEEYADAFIGGAMLRLDKRYMQVEAGAAWNGGYLNSLKSGLDLRNCDACLYNEIEEYREFNAWWYCCFPMSVVREDNLPLPLFIRGDDVEYGLRNMKHLILMNGICVWHEPFENKYSSFLEYYIVRNQLIDNSFHCQWFNAKHLKANIMRHCMQEIMYYRYKNIDLYVRGVEDFLKGPEWLMRQDSETLHKEIMAAGYRAQDVETLPMPFNYSVYEMNCEITDTFKARLKRIVSLNGLLLRARGETIVPMAAPKSIMFYRKKRIMHYDVTSHKAFITEKNSRESWRCIFKTIGLLWKVNFKLKRAQEAYRIRGTVLRTLDFWNEFLSI